MSSNPQQVNEGNPDDLAEEIKELESRVKELEAILRSLQSNVGQFNHAGDPGSPGAEQLHDLYFADFPLGAYLLSRISEDDLKYCELAERIHNLEIGEVDPGDVIAESNGLEISDLMPLHQNYLAAANLDAPENGLTSNQEIAARLFPYLHEKAVTTGYNKLVLPSTEVRNIIEDEIATPELAERLDVRNPNPNTIIRVMDFIDRFTPDWITVVESSKPRKIVIEEEKWKEYASKVTQFSEKGDSTYDVVNTDEEVV